MNASEISFGIEIETTMPSGYAVGFYHRGIQATGLPEGWTAQSDCSIQASTGRVGCEFVSPILRGEEGMRQVVEVVAKLNEIGAHVNQSTGLHVHVGFSADSKALDRLVALVSFSETAIYATTGTHSRENGGFCRSLRRHGKDQAKAEIGRNRYHILNLVPLLNGQRQAVEFRAFAGTLNVVKLTGYIRLCIALVEKALESTKTTSWEPKTPSANSPVRRNGIGATEVARLYYLIGWTKGRTAKTYGNIQGCPTIAEVKKEFKRLVKKYDKRLIAREAVIG